jgi:hypothetical protein
MALPHQLAIFPCCTYVAAIFALSTYFPCPALVSAYFRTRNLQSPTSQLQSKGLIRYQRGYIQIIDTIGLETAACECYGLSKQSMTARLV